MKEQINELIKTAMRSKDTVSLKVLKVVKGEVQTLEKRSGNDLTDAEVVKVINKLINSIQESKGPQEEIDVLTPLVPSKLTDDELRNEITSFIEKNNLSGIKEMKTVMHYLNEFYAGRYDGKVASGIIKENL